MAKSREAVYDQFHPESAVATEFRRLLHNATRPVNGIDPKAFLITSAMLAEGKSTISAHLAITAASYKNKKTILIDCDLRRPVQHKHFDLPLKGGVTEIIRDKLKPEESFKKTKIENLFVLTAGRLVKNPSELFEGDSVKNVIEAVKFYFDLVIVDCAPIIPVSDPLVLAPELDGILLVVKAGKTQKEVIRRSADLIEKTGSKVTGVILNNMKSVLPYYFDHKYYGYNYTTKKQ